MLTIVLYKIIFTSRRVSHILKHFFILSRIVHIVQPTRCAVTSSIYSLLWNNMQSRSESALRWIILLLNCMLMTGDYFCDELSAAIKPQIENYMNNPSDFEFLFNLLYSIPAGINTILPFFSGFILDRFGARNCMLVFVTFVAMGHVVFTIGLGLKSWAIMFLGRAIFGLGDSSTSVSNLTMLVIWFGGGSELALALSINLSASRLGSVVNNLVSPSIASNWQGGVVSASWVAVAVLTASVASACGIFFIDKFAEAAIALSKNKIQKSISTYGSINSTSDPEDKAKNIIKVAAEDECTLGKISVWSALDFPRAYKLLALYCLLIYGILFVAFFNAVFLNYIYLCLLKM
jgi:MFS family permease